MLLIFENLHFAITMKGNGRNQAEEWSLSVNYDCVMFD